VLEGGGLDPAVAGGVPEQVAAGGVDDRGAAGGADGQVTQVGVVVDQDGGDGLARAWEPRRLRLRLLAVGRIVRGGRRLRLRLAATSPRASQLTAAITRLQALALG
jgi:hypothetical protein